MIKITYAVTALWKKYGRDWHFCQAVSTETIAPNSLYINKKGNFFHTMYEKPFVFFIFVFYLCFLRKHYVQTQLTAQEGADS